MHILGNVSRYHLGSNRKDDYRLTEFTDVYLDFEYATCPYADFLQSIYHNGKPRYGVDMTSDKAWECFENYIKDFAATELSIFECNQDTLCGNYWCDMSDV